MGVIHGIRDVLSSALGVRIMRQLPFGNAKFIDVSQRLPAHEVRTVLDIGANVGQSAEKFVRAFPQATIYSCEPVAATFAKLEARDFPDRVHRFHIALGAKEGSVKMEVVDDEAHSVTNSIKGLHPAAQGQATHLEKVHITTLDAFCPENGVDRIDYLKIDTEGHDLEVLMGGAGLLASGRVGLVDVEVGMNALNEFHVPLVEVVELMARTEHYLFGLYDQLQEYEPPRPILRRCNALFVSKQVAEANSGK